MYYHNCGNNLKNGNQFCNKCGKTINNKNFNNNKEIIEDWYYEK